MTLERPTRRELVEKLQAAIESRLTHEQLRRSDARVYARSFAATADAIYSLIEYYHRQQFVWSCDAEYLDRHASLYGVIRHPATTASGKVRFDVTGGGVVPAGTELKHSDRTYATQADSDRAGEAAVVAAVPGADGNLDAGETLYLETPIAGVGLEAVVATKISGGTDAESDDDLRARTLVRMRETPQGGAAADYKNWALEVPGVTRAWAYPEEDGEGTVTVRFACDNQEDSVVPDSEMVQKVRNHINELRPVCAKVSVVAPVAYPVDIVFSSLGGDSEATRAVIEADLKRFFRDEAEPGGRLYLSRLNAVISNAYGETDHALTAPTADIVPGAGRIPVLGQITWP